MIRRALLAIAIALELAVALELRVSSFNNGNSLGFNVWRAGRKPCYVVECQPRGYGVGLIYWPDASNAVGIPEALVFELDGGFRRQKASRW